MTAVIVCLTLLAVAVLAIGWARYCEVSREVEVAIRNTPAPYSDVADDDWSDCPVCAVTVARLRALFNDTNPKGD